MQLQVDHAVLHATGACTAHRETLIQQLWSGYGEIVRYALKYEPQMDNAVRSAILKHVIFPSQRNHPRGWNNDASHQRKVTSYQVEMAWYQTWSQRCDGGCRVPRCYGTESIGDEQLMVLEDLDAAGFSGRKNELDIENVQLCLHWLAHFHATFMGEVPSDLWPIGTYWHWATRQDEWAAIKDESLKKAAPVLDAQLNTAQFQTILHGDAKVANFCFSDDGRQVAAVDFQYVGGGCGIKDVAYFLGSCMSDRDQISDEPDLLDYYFDTLHTALLSMHKTVDFAALEREWRRLFPVAQTDFYRFLVGWMPTHWKINDHSKDVALRVLAGL